MHSQAIMDNVRRLREEIAESAQKVSKTGDAITLVAATKTQSAQTVRMAVEAGVDACAENRVQELLEKDAADAYAGVPLHFIGHLQKNKIRKVTGTAALIQSVDSLDLLQGVDRCAGELACKQDILVQVNVGNDRDKFGIDPKELEGFLEQAEALQHIRIRGLMTMLPILSNPRETRALYAQMYQIYVDISNKIYHNIKMDFLSMGMSGDYQDAILEGANMIRIGSTIFGDR